MFVEQSVCVGFKLGVSERQKELPKSSPSVPCQIPYNPLQPITPYTALTHHTSNRHTKLHIPPTPNTHHTLHPTNTHLIECQQLVAPVQHPRVCHILHLHVKGVEQQAAVCSTTREGGAVDGAASSLRVLFRWWMVCEQRSEKAGGILCVGRR